MTTLTKAVATPVQAYIANNLNVKTLKDFKDSIPSEDLEHVFMGVLKTIDSDTFVSGASLIEDFRNQNMVIDFQFEGFTTNESRLAFHDQYEAEIQRIVLRWVNDDNDNNLGEWLYRLHVHFPENQRSQKRDYAKLAEDWLYGDLSDQDRDLIASAMVCEIIEVLASNLMGHIERIVDKEGVGTPNHKSKNKEQVLLFLASRNLATASIAHCLVNRLSYRYFVEDCKAVANNEERKTAWYLALESEQACAEFFEQHHPKIMSYFKLLGCTSHTPLSLNQFLARIHRESGIKGITAEQVQEIMQNNDSDHEEYGRVAEFLIEYIHNDMRHQFINFVENHLGETIVEVNTKDTELESSLNLKAQMQAQVQDFINHYKDDCDMVLADSITSVVSHLGHSKFILAAQEPTLIAIEDLLSEKRPVWFVNFFTAYYGIIQQWAAYEKRAEHLSSADFSKNTVFGNSIKRRNSTMAVEQLLLTNDVSISDYNYIVRRIVVSMIISVATRMSHYIQAGKLREIIKNSDSNVDASLRALRVLGFDTEQQIAALQNKEVEPPLVAHADIRKQAYDEGYAQAKADMLALFNKL